MVGHMRVGILALQGAFREHAQTLGRLGVETRLVRRPAELEEIEALVIPGGESTTIGRLLFEFSLVDKLLAKAKEGLPVFGTCAGMVLMAREIEGIEQRTLGLMDITVRRNAFGRQVESFEADLQIPVLGDKPFRGVFIRAPFVTRVGAGVEVLAEFEGKPVLVRQGKLLACAFHPELTNDLRLHRYFLEEVAKA
ncbi:SNO glutamine amidotransferase [Ammonifex degensii KC4]|uniref:Pyridoxal 5'-phosphate synthase subunit PdxT n=2 Tax=Ammonifex degensii TaxID=42838 RepID=C9RA76_AMMDK|nr:SNO glutamine amidotransferase [Ammonifex degensii KC4]